MLKSANPCFMGQRGDISKQIPRNVSSSGREKDVRRWDEEKQGGDEIVANREDATFGWG
jgi:hypothetical protein